MRPTEQLKEEHKAILLMIDILTQVVAKLEEGERVDPKDLEAIVEFIRVFADKCHHAKEEDLLFPAMELAGVPKEGGPIEVMLMDHDQGRQYVRGLTEAVEKYKSGEEKAGLEIATNAKGYINLLRDHIYKEDNILYEIADMHLSEKQQEDLLQNFEKVETERIGQGQHEEFHRLLDRLKETYLD